MTFSKCIVSKREACNGSHCCKLLVCIFASVLLHLIFLKIAPLNFGSAIEHYAYPGSIIVAKLNNTSQNNLNSAELSSPESINHTDSTDTRENIPTDELKPNNDNLASKIKIAEHNSHEVASGKLSNTSSSEPIPQLSRSAIPLGVITPKYPDGVNGVSGRVKLLLNIDETGGVVGFRILSSNPMGVFDDAAVTAFASAKYSPGLLLGIPIKSEFVVEVSFDPIANPAQSQGY